MDHHVFPPRTGMPPGAIATPTPGGVDVTDDVPIVTKTWCTIVMIPLAGLMCLLQLSFSASGYPKDSPGFYWMILGTLVSFVAGFILVARAQYPEQIFWMACILVVTFPFDPLIVVMSLTSLLARRASQKITIRAILAATAVCLYAQLRDAFHPAGSSWWHVVFSKPDTGGASGKPVAMLTGEPVIVVTAGAVALIAVAIGTLLGLHIRSRARLKAATAKMDAAQTLSDNLQNSLADQQLADAIAAEAHDTLAHSLSLIAVNASALQAQTNMLARRTTGPAASATLASDIEAKAADIRRQAAGALDEAHSVIDMLRNPLQAKAVLVPTGDTALTRESLDGIIADARDSGMALNTWIDIRQLGELDEHIGTIAYRAVQEGLTNARRHAPGAPVSLEVTASDRVGVHVHISNPPAIPDVGYGPGSPEGDGSGHHGSGLSGIAARVRSVGGECRYGFDAHRLFHVEVALPWNMAPVGEHTANPHSGE